MRLDKENCVLPGRRLLGVEDLHGLKTYHVQEPNNFGESWYWPEGGCMIVKYVAPDNSRAETLVEVQHGGSARFTEIPADAKQMSFPEAAQETMKTLFGKDWKTSNGLPACVRNPKEIAGRGNEVLGPVLQTKGRAGSEDRSREANL